MAGRWAVEVRQEPPADFHARALPAPIRRAVWVCEPTVSTLVLGSTQGDEVVERAACERAGIAVVRRRSGGGTVLVEPGGLLWIDVLLPAGDPLWEADVAAAFLWLGDTWVSALGAVGIEAEVHRGGLCTTPWSRLVCFGGLGTGEVVRPDAGPKLVGLSQRRGRAGARFQCAALARWEPERLVPLLAVPPEDQAEAIAALAPAAQGISAPLSDLRAAFLAELDRH
jgi:lipoate-protein ligase A